MTSFVFITDAVLSRSALPTQLGGLSGFFVRVCTAGNRPFVPQSTRTGSKIEQLSTPAYTHEDTVLPMSSHRTQSMRRQPSVQ